MTDQHLHDAIVVGGGPAGLAAALMLGRTRRDVVLLDSGTYRNDPTDAMHNVLGFDGTPPAEFRATAHRTLAAYDTVELRRTTVHEITSAGTAAQPSFVVRTDGGEIAARRLLLATGLRDELPSTPGLADLFGTVAAHCPYCHGHEFRGTPVGLLGAGPHTPRVAGLMERIASRLVVLADGGTLDPQARAGLERRGVEIRPEPVVRLEPHPFDDGRPGLLAVLDGGDTLTLGGLMVAPALHQAAPFAAQLGLELRESGCVAIDAFARTSLPGVMAAGDLAHTADLPMPLASVTAAMAAGQLAAAAIDGDLLEP
ncbi:NAD(P)/FAD-dependent oxidoreductase [Isoptericola sp. NEAU-Y5]|uniref:NAD(P)/FAD-dependent oxidoreductase n=1 Tax=Isoptericola luteus TaxID=2879484 RepID=A0ABS7ZEF4_9MICO|nr:NAD(P)/FAD-dependent oxidoreductase [Isoptericola sp. NEAU-Y5]MCA5893293.1 NAD(P)/FAD-dependent oxidoreductase [Isoptericola sp. NEAU-Y5]